MDPERFFEWCRQEVTRRKVPWIGRHMPVDGEQIHYVEAGSGDPLLLVHGFLGWSYSWRHNVRPLARSARVLAPDLRGFGLSQKDRNLRHTLWDHAEVLHSFMEATRVEQAVLCGHSLGGEICLRLAIRHPEHVRALILVASTGYVQYQPGRLERLFLGLPMLSEIFVRFAAMTRTFAYRTLKGGYSHPEKIAPIDVDAYLLPARAPGAPATLVTILRDLDLGRYQYRLDQLQVPVLIIWGEDDPYIPLYHGQRLAAELPDSRLVVFPDCGHFVQEEMPDLFNRTVTDFLSGLKKPSGPA